MGEQKQKYLDFIAYLQIIGIILVVFGHSFQMYPDTESEAYRKFYFLLFNVRMPMFTFVSGFLLYYTSFLSKKPLDVGRFVQKKAARLLLPFVVLTTVTFVPRALASGIADDVVQLDWTSFGRAFVYSDAVIPPFFWFIQMSFILLVSSYAAIWLARRSHLSDWAVLVLLAVLLLVLPEMDFVPTHLFAINDVLRLGFFFVAGMAYCCWRDRIDKALRVGSPLTLLVSAAMWILIYLYGDFPMSWRVASLCGITAFVSLAKLLDDKEIRILDHLKGANYLIFLLSWYVNVAAQQVLSHFVALPWWIYTVLSLVCGVYIPAYAYRYLMHHQNSRWVRLTSFLLGQSFRNKPLR